MAIILFVKRHADWATTFLHYSAGDAGEWTNLPGIEIPTSTFLAERFDGAEGWHVAFIEADGVVFTINDGDKQWDNNDGRDYVIDHAGIYVLESSKLERVDMLRVSAKVDEKEAAVAAAAAPEQEDAFVPVTAVLYKTKGSWKQTYFHHSVDGKAWSEAPGIAFQPLPAPGLRKPRSLMMVCVSGSQTTFVTTDGKDKWDNNAENNYTIGAPGIYKLADGNMSLVDRAPMIEDRKRKRANNDSSDYEQKKAPVEADEAQAEPAQAAATASSPPPTAASTPKTSVDTPIKAEMAVEAVTPNEQAMLEDKPAESGDCNNKENAGPSIRIAQKNFIIPKIFVETDVDDDIPPAKRARAPAPLVQRASQSEITEV